MELILKRKFDIITYFSKYGVSINDQRFIVVRNKDLLVNIDNNKKLKIEVIVRNYYMGATEIDNVKPNTQIVIKTSYNKLLFLILFTISIGGLIYNVVANESIFLWISLLLFLLYQIFFLHVKRKSFFQIYIQE